MFGLMRAKKCGMTDEEKRFRRLHYCGTCKTIGALYSQKARFLLNHDTVFLAEFLSALKGDETKDWQQSYQSFNCLNLPETAEMPLALRYAATANLILTEFKLADHLTDEGKRRYRYAARSFAGEFQKAETLLEKWNFPLAEIKEILHAQETVEAEAENLEDFARPTAETTAAFFAHGAKLVGKEDLEKSARAIGFNFGKLIYFLDAFEDYEKDFRAGKFNAFRAAFDLTDEKLSAAAKRRITTLLREIESEIVKEIHLLPINDNQKNLFVSRLAQNLARKLQTKLPVAVKTKSVCVPKRKPTFAEKWANARAKAQNLARGFSWQMPLVFLFVFAFALVAPAAQAKEARSARECFDLSFNLMFLSAVFGSVLAFPKTILMQNPEEQERKSQQAADGCTCCCDGCCCGCDACEGGCCDGCCCCCCDGCDC